MIGCVSEDMKFDGHSGGNYLARYGYCSHGTVLGDRFINTGLIVNGNRLVPSLTEFPKNLERDFKIHKNGVSMPIGSKMDETRLENCRKVVGELTDLGGGLVYVSFSKHQFSNFAQELSFH